MKELLLIDSHALLHRFFHALPPLTTPQHEPIGAIYGLSVVLLKILREEKPNYVAAALDRPEPTFRKEQFNDYKIHRPPAASDLISQIKRLPDLFEKFNIRAFSLPGYEADDVIGTLARCYEGESDLKTTILSGDLDILQLVQNDAIVARIIKSGTANTVLYNERGVEDRYGISPQQIPDYKGLIGDSSDNIPGVKGIGPKTAAELLKEFKTIPEIFSSIGIISPKVAKKLEGQEKIAELSRELARIRCDIPITCPPLQELSAPFSSSPDLPSYFEELGFTSLVKRL